MAVAELLALDPDIVQSEAEAYEGYAVALSKNDQGIVSAALLSHYNAIAASYWAIVDGRKAARCFVTSARYAMAQAGQSLENMRNDKARYVAWRIRATVLNVCGGVFELPEQIMIENVQRASFSPDALQELVLTATIATLFNQESRKRSDLLPLLLERVNEQQESLAGIMQLPLRFSAALATLAMDEPADDRRRVLRTWGNEFSSRLTERVRLAQRNRLDWLHLNTQLLPIEPETLLMVAAWRHMTARVISPEGFDKLLSRLPPEMQAYDLVARNIQTLD